MKWIIKETWVSIDVDWIVFLQNLLLLFFSQSSIYKNKFLESVDLPLLEVLSDFFKGWCISGFQKSKLDIAENTD